MSNIRGFCHVLQRRFDEAGRNPDKMDMDGLPFGDIDGQPMERPRSKVHCEGGEEKLVIHTFGHFGEEIDQWWELIEVRKGHHWPHRHMNVGTVFCFTQGRGWLYRDGVWEMVKRGTVVEIPAGMPHGFLSDEDVTFVSIQLGGQMIAPEKGGEVDYVPLSRDEYVLPGVEEQAHMLGILQAEREEERNTRMLGAMDGRGD